MSVGSVVVCPELLYKVLLIGELGVGKTSIIKRYVHHIFSQHYRATIGVDFALKVLQWDHDTVIRLQLWDIAGQERYGNMTRVYYREAVGAMVVFDVTRASTFDAVLKWKNDLDSKVQLTHWHILFSCLLINVPVWHFVANLTLNCLPGQTPSSKLFMMFMIYIVYSLHTRVENTQKTAQANKQVLLTV
uniref:Ras-related protein Rab n=1 Tax=Gouania willdenowi TaxID=441366 RepID=A0A8C5DX16_GOUWI